MKYQVRAIRDVHLVEVLSPCVPDPDAPNLHHEVRKLLEEGARKFCIDMSGCRFTTSGGIGVLAAILTSVQRVEGKLTICNVSRRVHTVLDITRVLPMLDIRDNREEALEALGLNPEEAGQAG